jgi:hypothetical protein
MGPKTVGSTGSDFQKKIAELFELYPTEEPDDDDDEKEDAARDKSAEDK